MHHDPTHGEPDSRPWWHIRRSLLATFTAGLLLAGCTGQAVNQATPPGTTQPTFHATAVATNTALPAETVHVKLHIETDQPATVRYSNGITTVRTDMAVEGNGDAGTLDVEFDAPRPFVAAATVATTVNGQLSCELSTDEFGSSGSTVTDDTLASCSASEDQLNSFGSEPVDGEHLVVFKSTTTTSDGLAMWASQNAVGEDRADLPDEGIATSQRTGTVRMLVVAVREGGTVTCQVLVDKVERTQATTAGVGDIANCSTSVD